MPHIIEGEEFFARRDAEAAVAASAATEPAPAAPVAGGD